ncbi:MAG: hypothetical protein K1X88_23285 [Nannocystaceae bacterium]|nr:hypothetical protein [Nannocystaceae bacterium]
MSVRSDRGSITARVVRIGRFVCVDDLTAAAGPARTIAAWDPELDRRVALRAIGGVDDDAAQRAAQRLAQVQHPNVARVLEVFDEGGQRFVALETVSAPPLSQWCRRTPGPSARACVEAALAAARGLAAIHTAGALHGALAQTAIRIDERGRVRLCECAVVVSGDREAAMDDECRALCQQLAEAFSATAAPAWLAASLRRGAAEASPRAGTLVAVIERGRGRTRRRWFGLAAVGLAGATWLLTRPRPDPCIAALEDFTRPPVTVAASEAEPAALRLARGYARARLDDYWQQLHDEFAASCAAKLADGSLPRGAALREVHDGTVECLDEAREVLAVVSQTVEDSSVGQAEVGTMPLALPELRLCRERTRASASASLRERALLVARASAFADLGRVSPARSLLAELDAQGWDGADALHSRAEIVRANIDHLGGDRAGARRASAAAVHSAQRADDWVPEGTAWALHATMATAAGELDEAAFAAARAVSIGEALGAWPVLSDARRAQAEIARLRGEYEQAIARLREAEQIIVLHERSSAGRLARVYSDMVQSLTYTERHREAVEVARRAVALFEADTGADSAHSRHARAVLGWALADAGRASEALAVLTEVERAFAADPNASAQEHGTVATRLVEQLAATRRFDDAIARAQEFIDRFDDPELLAFLQQARAGALLDAGRAAEAADAFAALRAALPEGRDPAARLNRAALEANLAVAWARSGRAADAAPLLATALEVYRRLGLPDRRIARLLLMRAEVQRRAGEAAAAVATVREARPMLQADGGVAAELGWADLELAKALAASGEVAAAREAARAAMATLTQVGDATALAEAEALSR